MTLSEAQQAEVRFIVAGMLSEQCAAQAGFLEAVGRHLADIQAQMAKLEWLISVLAVSPEALDDIEGNA